MSRFRRQRFRAVLSADSGAEPFEPPAAGVAAGREARLSGARAVVRWELVGALNTAVPAVKRVV